MKRGLDQDHWQELSEAAMRRKQAEQLRRYLRSVVLPFSAHYRQLFREHRLKPESFQTLDDLQALPFTTKADLLNSVDKPERFKDFILIPDPKLLARRPGTIARALLVGRQRVKLELEREYRPIFMTFTTGRSGEPTPFAYTRWDLDRLAISGRRLVEICTARSGERVLNAFPFAPHLAFWLAHYAGTEAGLLMLSSGGGKVMGTEGNLRLLGTFKPNVVLGMPTFMYHLLSQAADEGMRFENLRAIVLGGEKVSEGLRSKLRELAHALGARKVDVLAIYGFTEARLAWAECPFPADGPSGGFHLYPDLGIIELVDPHTGKVVPPGQPGEIVFTPLDARGSVVLRFRTGDYVDGGLTCEPCPYCGRVLPRLTGNLSRRSEIKEMDLHKLKGTLVDFNQLEHLLDNAPHIGAWQVELRKINDDPHDLDEIVLHVHKTDGADASQLSRDLSERCWRQIEVRPNRILFHTASEIRQLQGVGVQLKEQRLVDHRPLSNGRARPDEALKNGEDSFSSATVNSPATDEA